MFQAVFSSGIVARGRLKTGDRTQFLKLLFYIYFGIWSFIHTKVKIYTFIKRADYTQGLLYIIFILSFFNNVQ